MIHASPLRRIIAAVLAFTVGSGCAREADTGPPPILRIGLLATLEGPFAESSGRPSVLGAQMAADEINQAGGVDVGGTPHQVEIVVRAYANRPDDAAIQARSLINQEGIHALVGPQLSNHAIPVALVAEQAHLPMISPMSSNPETTAGKRWVFRLAFVDDFQGRVLARFAREDLAATRAAILYDESAPYSRGLARRFTDEFGRLGGTVAAAETFTSDRVDTFVPQLTRIQAADPEVLFLPNDPEVDSIQMREARELGIRAVFLGSDTWDLQSLIGLPWAEGSYVTHQWHFEAPSPSVARFLEAYRERFGGAMPRTTAAMTYDAVRLLADAAHRAGTIDAGPLRDALANTLDYQGATGVISFHGTGDPERSAVVSRLGSQGTTVERVIDP